MSRFFICYRRAGDPFAARQIYHSLVEHFGRDQVFMDVNAIPMGVNIEEHITQRLGQCDAMLVVIDRNWLEARDETGKRRLEDPEDFVRREIEGALNRGVLAIPVLVGAAALPRAKELPETLRDLVGSLGTTIRPDEFDDDMRRLIAALEKAPVELEAAREESRHFQRIWESGDWVAAQRVLDSALERGGGGLPPYRMLAKKRPVVERLGTAAQLVEKADFQGALDLLEEVRLEEGPPNLCEARAVAAIGVRLASPELAVEQAMAEEEEFKQVIETARGKGAAVIPGEREVAALLVTQRREAAYRQAVALYDAARFSKAREAFAALGDFRDAQSRVALCGDWIDAFARLKARAWEEAKTRLRGIRAKDPTSPVDKWLKWATIASILVSTLERMEAGPFVAEPRAPWEGGECPYEVLGVPPAASAEHSVDLAYDLQARPGGMSQAERQAWDALRRVEKRLLVDFGLYRVMDPSGPRHILERLCAVTEGTDPVASLMSVEPASDRGKGGAGAGSALAMIGSALGRDGGVFHALRSDYDTAIELFLAEVRAQPEDPFTFHHLGLAAAAKIQVQGAAEDDLGDAWETLIQGWGAIFGDDRFWHKWWSERRRTYPVTAAQIQDARNSLQRFWVDETKAVADRYPGLDLQMQVEIHGARAVQAGGGIPVTAGGQKRAVVGLLGARTAGLQEAVSRWTASFDLEQLRKEGWQRRVCIYFSQLAEAAALAEDGRFAEVVRTAAAVQPSRADFVGANPGFAGLAARAGERLFEECRREMLEQAHVKMALSAVSEFPVDVGRAIEHWRQAVAQAAERDAVEPLLQQIRDVAIGRTSFLCGNEIPRRLDALNDAVKLLQEVLDEGWDREQVVKGALVESLLERAIHLSNKYDAERDARLDAQRAWGMAPTSLRAISVLCATSLHDARDLFIHGRQPLAEALLKEVEQHLDEGEKIFPGSTDLATTRQNAGLLREMLAGGGTVALARGLKEITTATPDSTADRARTRLTEAMLKEVRQEFAGAIDIYWDLVKATPEDRQLKGMMAWCYRSWIQHARNAGDESSEVRQIAREARERLPGFDALSDLGMETSP